jgi:hypothetical protein
LTFLTEEAADRQTARSLKQLVATMAEQIEDSSSDRDE